MSQTETKWEKFKGFNKKIYSTDSPDWLIEKMETSIGFWCELFSLIWKSVSGGTRVKKRKRTETKQRKYLPDKTTAEQAKFAKRIFFNHTFVPQSALLLYLEESMF